jgi:hypothetical protein
MHARSLGWAFGGGTLLLVALVVASRRSEAPPPKPGPVVQAQPSCETLRAQYLAALAPLQTCTRDDECVTDRRDGVRSGLEHCARFRRGDALLDAVVDPLERAWLGRGCAHAFMTCKPRRAQCNAGRCAELPPDPVPRTWRRAEHASYMGEARFSFFVPPGFTKLKTASTDSEGGAWEGPSNELLYYEYGDYSPNLEPNVADGESTLSRQAVTISGAKANLIVTRIGERRVRSGIQFPEVPAINPGKQRLTMWSECATLADCADIPIIVRSIELH